MLRGAFVIMSHQSKYWGDVFPLSHMDRRPWTGQEGKGGESLPGTKNYHYTGGHSVLASGAHHRHRMPLTALTTTQRGDRLNMQTVLMLTGRPSVTGLRRPLAVSSLAIFTRTVSVLLYRMSIFHDTVGIVMSSRDTDCCRVLGSAVHLHVCERLLIIWASWGLRIDLFSMFHWDPRGLVVDVTDVSRVCVSSRVLYWIRSIETGSNECAYLQHSGAGNITRNMS